MTNELKAKLARKNKIVEFYQRGLLSDKEFEGFMKVEKSLDKLESRDMSIPNNFGDFSERDEWGNEPKYKANPCPTDFNEEDIREDLDDQIRTDIANDLEDNDGLPERRFY